ncbi:MAG: hypothetical protein WDM71_03340 [Ferruginibacter sp.]
MQDSSFFDESPENPYWINISFPTFNGEIFLSYKIIGGKSVYKVKTTDGTYKDSIGINNYDKIVNDAFNLTNKNNVIATSIKDSLIETSNGISGIFLKLAAMLRQPNNSS